MIRVVVETEIGRPPEEVFSFLSDFERNTEWQDGMQSCVFTSDAPLRVGSTYEQVAKFRRKEVVSSFAVTALDAGRSITIEAIESTFPIKVTRSVAPAADTATTKVRAVIEGGPTGFMGMMSPILQPMVRRSVRKDYARLKAMLEA